MGISKVLGKMFGEAAAQPIEALGNLFDKLFTSEEEKLQAKAVLEKLAQHPGELQVELNKIEAAHRSVWVAGWRPAIGWVSAVSLAAFFIPQYFIAAWLWANQALATGTLPPYPVTTDGLMELVIAMLGFGTMRMVEKSIGRAK